ncbi:hypothetical protein V8E54_012335 [Elaphomyces granulatus]
MDPGEVPAHLPALSQIEEMLIARVHVHLEAERLQYRYTDTVCPGYSEFSLVQGEHEPELSTSPRPGLAPAIEKLANLSPTDQPTNQAQHKSLSLKRRFEIVIVTQTFAVRWTRITRSKSSSTVRMSPKTLPSSGSWPKA